MFGLLSSSSQIYGLPHAEEHQHNTTTSTTIRSSSTASTSNLNSKTKHRRTTSSVSDSSRETKKFFASISAPSSLLEKFIKSDLVSSSYDTIRNLKNSGGSDSASEAFKAANLAALHHPDSDSRSYQQHRYSYPDGILTSFNCLQGSYRTNCDGEFYEAVNVNNKQAARLSAATNTTTNNTSKGTEMTIKCSKNLLAEPPHQSAPATLQNYQKLPECEINDCLPNDIGGGGSGASSGEFNSSSNSNSDANNSSLTSGSISLYKRLSFGRIGGGSASDNQKSSDGGMTTQSNITTDTSNSTASTAAKKASAKPVNDLQRTSSASSSGDCNISSATAMQRKKSSAASAASSSATTKTDGSALTAAEAGQRRKLMQMISNYDQQNKLLQRELAKEKRRRTEELACVVKSLLCFESKLKSDMKTVMQRMQEKDTEICRLVMQNRALRKKVAGMQKLVQEAGQRDEGVVEDQTEEEEEDADEEVADAAEPKQKRGVKMSACGGNGHGDGDGKLEGGADDNNADDVNDAECLVLEALQCINCRKQFYAIDLKEGWPDSNAATGPNDDPTTEHGSSSDDTVSSSFYGARRSVRYTSKRTAGTFRDYMRSRSMNIEDPSLDNNSEENASSISREDSQTSYEKMNVYSRLMERMHGVKCDSEHEESQHSAGAPRVSVVRSSSRLSNKSSGSSKASSEKSRPQIDEDDGIFSPTQDDDFDEEEQPLRSSANSSNNREVKIVQRRSTEFSEASPKQVYETSTDDWYASASDPEEITSATPSAAKSYGQGAVNPVLECVNQILLQQSMEEPARMDVVCPPASPNEPKQNTFPRQQKLGSNLPQRSSLSARRANNLHCSNAAADSQQAGGRTGTLTRKRVHFSTKNSMVHVPRNDEPDVEDGSAGNACVLEDVAAANNETSDRMSSHYHPMTYYHSQTQLTTATSKGLIEVTAADTLNYESIYSNEYEPIIGSEHNGSNLYVDMESTTKMTSGEEGKLSKLPPALPPKPANLIKFKKPLQQLDELMDEQNQDAESTVAPSEPDYCSISEVKITSVQIVADVHHKAESEADGDADETHSLQAISELDVEVSTVVSDDTCADTHKTDDIEEIFADIPKLPNVAAIIAPKKPKYALASQPQTGGLNSDYLVMSPKVSTPIIKPQSARKLMLNSPVTPLKLQLHPTPTGGSQQHKRKHVPNILAEINKRMSLPNSPTTPQSPLVPSKPVAKSKALFRNVEESSASNGNLPLQAEFDWYNLDAEYGKAPHNPPDLLKVNDSVGGGSMNVLADIREDHESIVTAADEYNLDEEFSLASEKDDQMDVLESESKEPQSPADLKANLKGALCEAINFPLFSESSPAAAPVPNTKAKKIKKNLANFEKFIEGSGMSTKQLPNKQKIYFAGPFV